MEEKKDNASKEALKAETNTATEAKSTASTTKSSSTNQSGNNTIFAVGGVIGVIIFCCLCCCISFFALAQTDGFQDEYCESFLEDNEPEDDPLGICEDWLDEQVDEILNDLDFDFDFDSEL